MNDPSDNPMEFDIASVEAFLEGVNATLAEEDAEILAELEARAEIDRQNQIQLGATLREQGMNLRLGPDQSITEKSIDINQKIKKYADRAKALVLGETDVSDPEEYDIMLGILGSRVEGLQVDAERLHVVASVSHCMPIKDHPVEAYHIEEAVRLVNQSLHISADERSVLLQNLELIVGDEAYGDAANTVFSGNILEDHVALELEELAEQEAQERRARKVVDLMAEHIGGEHTNHDDWNGFVRTTMTLAHIVSLGSPESVTKDVEVMLRQKATRMGISEAAQDQFITGLYEV